MTRVHMTSGGRYPVLRVLGILLLIGAAGALCYGLYKTGWALFASPNSVGERVELGLQWFAVTFFGVVTIVAVAELIKLMIDVEHNTRVAAVHTAPATTISSDGNGATVVTTAGGTGHVNRMAELEEESAEAALIRGH